MFTTGLLISAGGTIAIALLDNVLESSGYQWVGTILRIAIPLGGMIAGVYFLETNEILRWLR